MLGEGGGKKGGGGGGGAEIVSQRVRGKAESAIWVTWYGMDHWVKEAFACSLLTPHPCDARLSDVS